MKTKQGKTKQKTLEIYFISIYMYAYAYVYLKVTIRFIILDNDEMIYCMCVLSEPVCRFLSIYKHSPGIGCMTYRI